MTTIPAWVRLPNKWIEAKDLQQFRWQQGTGANEIAALMALMAIAHHANQETGIARATYTTLTDATALSRDKLSKGLNLLRDRNIIENDSLPRSQFKLVNFDKNANWSQLPAKGLYKNGNIYPFRHFTLRNKNELNALKLYLLFSSRRDRKTNIAFISYPKIEEYSGVNRNNISAALSVLSSNNLIFTSSQASDMTEIGSSHGYRLSHLMPRQHSGTTGRIVPLEG